MADQTTLGSTKVNVGLELKGLRADFAAMRVLMTKQLSMMSLSFQKMGSSVKRVGNESVTAGKKMKRSFGESLKSALSLERMVSRLAFIGTVGAVYTLGRAINSTFKKGIDDAIAFEKQMANVYTMIEGVTYQIEVKLASGVSRLAVEFGQSTATMAKGLYDILSASISVKDSMGVLETASMAAVGGVTNTATAVDAITSVLNAYQMSAEEAGDVSDWLFAIVKRGKITFAELAQNIGKMIPTAGLLNMPLEEIGANIATMTRQGVKAREAMTALNKLMLNFTKPSEQAKEIAKGLGLELSANTIRTIGLTGVIEKLKYATEEEIAILTGSVRAFKSLATGVSDVEGNLFDLNFMLNRGGKALEAYEKIIGTTEFRVAQAKAAFNQWARDIQSFWLPVIKDATDAVMDFWSAANSLGKINLPEIELKEENAMKRVEAYAQMMEKMLGGESRPLIRHLVDADTIADVQNIMNILDDLKQENKIGVFQLAEFKVLIDLKKKQLWYENEILNYQEEQGQTQEQNRKDFWDDLNAKIGKGLDWEFIPEDESLEIFDKLKTTAEEVKEKVKEFNEQLKVFDAKEILGMPYLGDAKAAWDELLTWLEHKHPDTFLIMKAKEKEFFSESSSDYDKWRDKILEIGVDLKANWANLANELGGIDLWEKFSTHSIISADNIIDRWKEVYATFSEINPEIAKQFREMIYEVTGGFDWAMETAEAFTSAVSSGYLNMVQDVLDGANMMKKKWGEYFKEMANMFIYELNRMLVEWLAFKAITAIGNLLTGGGAGAATATPVGAGAGAGLPVPSTVITSIGSGGFGTGGASSTINNFNPSFSPNNNINATFSQRDMGFIYRQGKSYTKKTSL